jgi:hypothetical protein
VRPEKRFWRVGAPERHQAVAGRRREACAKLIGHEFAGKNDLGQAEGRKLIETFLNCEIEVTPKPSKSANNNVRQHDDERETAGPGRWGTVRKYR